MFKKILIASVCFVLIFSSLSWAQSWEMSLFAGTTSASGSVHYRRYVDTGFFKLGGTGVFVNRDTETYHLGSADFFVGSDTLVPGLTLEVGLRGFFGSAEENNDSGGIGAVGFAASSEYVFSKNIVPIPLEVFGQAAYSPDILSFIDCKNHFDITIGTGIRIGRYASIRLSYSAIRTEMSKNDRTWTSSDDAIRLGLVMRF